MSYRIQTAGWTLLAALLPSVAMAQRPMGATEASRSHSWEFSLGGGMLVLDPALRDFLASGTPESRFASDAAPGRGTPTAVARVGYNFTKNLGLSVAAGGARSHGVTYLNPSEAFTYSVNLDGKTIPFVMVGTELTRINGDNGRVTHSTYGAHAGLGVRQMVGENFALRAEGRMQFAGYDEVPMRRHTTFSPLVQLGFSYFVGGRKARMAMTTPVAQETFRPARVDTVRTTRVDTVTVVRTIAAPAMAVGYGDQVVLRVQFRTDRAELLPESRAVLDTVAAAIKATPNSLWVVEGHTDSTGMPASNRALSRARAQSVVDYLASQGVDRGIMTAMGFGPDRQVAPNTTAEGRAQNRRVQLRRVPPPPTQRVP
jgi:outer membrane protein OmpA-like peptidoglycan-associated protein